MDEFKQCDRRFEVKRTQAETGDAFKRKYVNYTVIVLVCLCRTCRKQRLNYKKKRRSSEKSKKSTKEEPSNAEKCETKDGSPTETTRNAKRSRDDMNGRCAVMKKPLKRKTNKKIKENVTYGVDDSIETILDVYSLHKHGIFTSGNAYRQHICRRASQSNVKKRKNNNDTVVVGENRQPSYCSSYTWCPFIDCGSRLPKKRVLEHFVHCHFESVVYHMEIVNDIENGAIFLEMSEEEERSDEEEEEEEEEENGTVEENTDHRPSSFTTKKTSGTFISANRRYRFNERGSLTRFFLNQMIVKDDDRQSLVLPVM